MKLILSSSSPARRSLLTRLKYPFEITSPDIDETELADETITETVSRLARLKAKAAIEHHPYALIIGCDQLISIKDQVLGKPHTDEKAIAQLQLCSNATLTSYTGLCLLNSSTGTMQEDVITYQVKFKNLSLDTIKHYIAKDTPLFCAGSIKAESLGPCLFEWMRGDDPTALTGLPLIRLNDMLLHEGLDVLQYQTET